MKNKNNTTGVKAFDAVCRHEAVESAERDYSQVNVFIVSLEDDWFLNGDSYGVFDSAAMALRHIPDAVYCPSTTYTPTATPAKPRYCKSCGEECRLRWPKDDPKYCGMRCAAFAFDEYAQVGQWEAAYCGYCGDDSASCEGDC